MSLCNCPPGACIRGAEGGFDADDEVCAVEHPDYKRTADEEC